MAPNSRVWKSAGKLLIILMLAITIFPAPAYAAPARERLAVPDLPTFAASVTDGNRQQLRGVYADWLFAFPVVQQLFTSYVSTKPDTVTQFGWPSIYGVTGLLAHDYLSGKAFSKLGLGQEIDLIYGDGRIVTYQVTRIFRYRATVPESEYSGFVDLDTGKGTDAEGLFRKVYMGTKHVTFQTCIAKDGNLSWGRLFVIAEHAETVWILAGGYHGEVQYFTGARRLRVEYGLEPLWLPIMASQ